MVKNNLIALEYCGKQSWSVAVNPYCIDELKHYILYERKNHPAKKGKGRQRTSFQEMDVINRQLYPNGLDDLLTPS